MNHVSDHPSRSRHPSTDELRMYSNAILVNEPVDELIQRIDEHVSNCSQCGRIMVELVRQRIRSQKYFRVRITYPPGDSEGVA